MATWQGAPLPVDPASLPAKQLAYFAHAEFQQPGSHPIPAPGSWVAAPKTSNVNQPPPVGYPIG